MSNYDFNPMIRKREPVEFCSSAEIARDDEVNDARWELVIAIVIAALATPAVAALASWLLPIVWGVK